MTVYNKDIKELIEEKVLPVVERNSDDLKLIKPLVQQHQIVLYGDPEKRKDEGMVGAFNKVEDLIDNIKKWVRPIGLSLLTAGILTILTKLIELARYADQMGVQ